VLSLSSSVSFMLPSIPIWAAMKIGVDPAKSGATKYEMLYIDGMNIGRGFTPVFDQSFCGTTCLSSAFPSFRTFSPPSVRQRYRRYFRA
jgi:outer membrane protein insertion porin family